MEVVDDVADSFWLIEWTPSRWLVSPACADVSFSFPVVKAVVVRAVVIPLIVRFDKSSGKWDQLTRRNKRTSDQTKGFHGDAQTSIRRRCLDALERRLSQTNLMFANRRFDVHSIDSTAERALRDRRDLCWLCPVEWKGKSVSVRIELPRKANEPLHFEQIVDQLAVSRISRRLIDIDGWQRTND